jgi:hypothetical protein
MRKSEHNVKVGQPKQFLFASGKRLWIDPFPTILDNCGAAAAPKNTFLDDRIL